MRTNARFVAQRLVFALVVHLAWLSPASAQTEYVTDRLQIGIHASASLDSPIVGMLESGGSVEILKREGPLTQIRAADGLEGWVDSAYLVKDKPATVALKSLGQQAEAQTAELAQAKLRLPELTQRIEQLEADLERAKAEAKQASSEAEQDLSQARAQTKKSDTKVRTAETAWSAATARADAAEESFAVAKRSSEIAGRSAATARASAAARIIAATSRAQAAEHSAADAQKQVRAAEEIRTKLESERKALQDELSAARAELEAAEALTTAPDVVLSVPAKAPIPTETLRELQHLAQENQHLKQELSDSVTKFRALNEARAAALQLGAAGDKPGAHLKRPVMTQDFELTGPLTWLSPYASIVRWKEWQWLLLGAALLLAGGLGAYLVDWRNRQRHGGFRI